MKHLVLVGGGHAHMTVMKQLRDFVQRGHAVTLVSPDPFHYYSGMGPGMLGGTYDPPEIRFHVKKMVEDRGAAFIESYAAGLRPADRVLLLADGREVGYDVLSFNIGSEVPRGGISLGDDDRIFAVKPIRELVRAREFLRSLAGPGKDVRVLVIGGGPGGVEIGGNAWRCLTAAGGRPEITIAAGRRFLPDVAEGVRRRIRESLATRSISIREGQRVSRCGEGRAMLEDGTEIPYDVAFLATGVRPPSLFADAGLPVGPDGGLRVNRFLQCAGEPAIFGGGDCIYFEPHPLAKVGVFAVRQNPVLAHNLLAALEVRPLVELTNTGSYLLIFNLGNDTGVFWKNWIVFNGRLAFRIKDRIDRKFMKEFQVSGEAEG